MSDVWGTVFQMERDKATGSDAESLKAENTRLRDVIDAAIRVLSDGRLPAQSRINDAIAILAR